jgi:flagellar biosynthesis/type III secretory pathway protein FliH
MQANVSIEGDFQIGRGGCKVLTDAGEIDATIETQIRLLKTILWSEE